MTTTCVGCLDTCECWVCLGTGAFDTEKGIGVCTSCHGSRSCRYCQREGRAAEDAAGALR